MPTLMTPKETAQAMARKLHENTGTSLEQWIALLKREGPATEKAAAQWLKLDKGLGHFQAQLVAKEAFGKSWLRMYDDPDALVDALYSGKKKGWRTLYERVLKLARQQGSDVQISVCSTYTSAYRKRQFAVLRPLVAGLEIKLGKDGRKLLVTSEAELNASLERAISAAYRGAA